jgi:hypothetical protein
MGEKKEKKLYWLRLHIIYPRLQFETLEEQKGWLVNVIIPGTMKAFPKGLACRFPVFVILKKKVVFFSDLHLF